MRVEVSASPEVERVLARLGRTEDLNFSPSGRRLAIAAFVRNSVVILDVAIAAARARKGVALTDCMELSSPALAEPHGVAFMGEDTLIVANRAGGVVVLEIPRSGTGTRKFTVPALDAMRGNKWVHSPGSVSVSHVEGRRYALLVCNNYAHYVSRHLLDASDRLVVASNDILVSKGLDVPDGVAVSRDKRWIAVSSHGTHGVLLYDHSRPLDYRSEPVGTLSGVHAPHGVRFTPDDEFVLVADAGAPFVFVYARDGESWAGTREPVSSHRVMDDATFLRGRYNPEEGGPKGIDIDPEARVLATTCEFEALAFFDVTEILHARTRAGTVQHPRSASGGAGDGRGADGGSRTTHDVPARAAPCPCGSGRRFKHCCGARDPRATVDPVASFSALMGEALQAQRSGSLDAAERRYQDALRMRPEHPDALHMLGVVYCGFGRLREAARLIRRAGELTRWGLPGIAHNYGLILGSRMLGRYTGQMAKVRLDYDRWVVERDCVGALEAQPLVSVLLIAGDHCRDIEASLESVYSQTYGNLELLVVGAAVTEDGTAVIRRKLEACPIPSRFVSVADRSFNEALNAALREADGSYVNPLCSGDLFEPWRIADMVQQVAHRRFEWGFAACQCIDAEGRATAPGSKAEAQWIAEIADHVRSSDTVGASLFSRLDPTVSPGNLFFSKSLSGQLGGFRRYQAAYGRDFCLRALRLAEPCFVPRASYRYRLRDADSGAEARDGERLEVDAIFTDYCRSVLDEPPANRFAPGHAPQRLGCLAKGLSVAQGVTLAPEVLTRLDDDLVRDDEQTMRDADEGKGDGLNIVGFFMDDFDLAESARALAATCRNAGIPAIFRDADGVPGSRRSNRAMDAWLTDDMPHRNTLFCMNPEQLMPQWRWHQDRGEARGRRIIGYWHWEIDAFPNKWRPALDVVDEIWVASEYVRDILRRVTDKPVIRLPHAFEVSPARRYARTEFSLPDQKFLFLFTFDLSSFVERKNPQAAIEAFARAFPTGDERGALVIKCTQGRRFPQQLERLRAMAAKDPRVIVLDRLLSRDEAFGLQSVCDAYVSLHRAEGLGLRMAECMAQGKPVIATGYSGNLDFMRRDNSCLVDYTLIPVKPEEYVHYEPGWLWADPDIDQAARYMVRLVDDPDYRREMGQRAASDMRSHHSHQKAATAINERLATLARAEESGDDLVGSARNARALSQREA